MIVARLFAFVAGVVIVQAIVRSAIRTMVVPRGEVVRLTRYTFLSMRALYDPLVRRKKSLEERERTFARYAPTSLLVLASLWALGTIVGFIPLYWAAGEHSLKDCVKLSGSSITTLGFIDPQGPFEVGLSFVEALLGLGVIALLISYLPTMYGHFSRREAEVVKLDVRAGSPPTALEMLSRFHRINWLDHLDETWATWEHWFAELEESHTSLAPLVFFRSQRPYSSWITCAGAVLDTAAVSLAALDIPTGPQAAVTLRSGFIALRAIAAFFGVPFDPDPAPNDPISIYREEFDLLLDDLEARGLPLKQDRDQAWRDFAGWRVTYDMPLLALCSLVDAPPTPWSSDRSDRFHRATLRHRHFRVDPLENPPSF